jgi:hypothetical protein
VQFRDLNPAGFFASPAKAMFLVGLDVREPARDQQTLDFS